MVWVNQLDLSGGKADQQLAGVEGGALLAKVVASWEGAFVDTLVDGLCGGVGAGHATEKKFSYWKKLNFLR